MKRNLFKWIYIAFAGLMVALALAAILYVRGLLVDYEAARPERQEENAIATLVEEAKKPGFWDQYGLPAVDKDIQKEYLALYAEELNYVSLPGTYAEDEMGYLIRKGSFPLAEVLLKAEGPAETRLAVFTTRPWKIEKITPVLQEREYTASLPAGFTLAADGVALTAKEEGGKAKFTLSGVWLEPEFTVTAADGTEVGYEVKNFRVVPAIFEYNFTLPATLKVTVNGKEAKGTALEGGRLRYELMELEQPEVLITDLYGNAFSYDGKTEMPLTYATVLAPAGYTVTLEGKAVADSAVTQSIVKEYAFLEGLVQDLPRQTSYDIAILKADAAIKVTDASGKEIALEPGQSEYDLSPKAAPLTAVPAEVAGKVDVLSVAQSWSLFMSNDVTFTRMAEMMAADSYQYEVAKKYSTSIDKQFFASHTLRTPAFTEEKVQNFTWITEDCFSVEVSFVKHMRLNNGGKNVDDAMNDRFYFVRQDGAWKLAGLKEVGVDE